MKERFPDWDRNTRAPVPLPPLVLRTLAPLSAITGGEAMSASAAGNDHAKRITRIVVIAGAANSDDLVGAGRYS